MGQEFAQFREWSEKNAVLTGNFLIMICTRRCRRMSESSINFMKNMMQMYVNDCEPIGFEWMSCDNADMSTVSFVRRGSSAKISYYLCVTLHRYHMRNIVQECRVQEIMWKVLSSDDEKVRRNRSKH